MAAARGSSADVRPGVIRCRESGAPGAAWAGSTPSVSTDGVRGRIKVRRVPSFETAAIKGRFNRLAGEGWKLLVQQVRRAVVVNSEKLMWWAASASAMNSAGIRWALLWGWCGVGMGLVTNR